MSNSKKDIKGLSRKELGDIFSDKEFPKFSPTQIFNWIYKKRVEDFSFMSNLSKRLRAYLQRNFFVNTIKLEGEKISPDKTAKYLFRLHDGSFIETALIPEKKRNTLCLSTQVGCKFGCKFCVSGVKGFKRNLDVSEIVNQYLKVSDIIAPNKITNVVFMGVGEPLDNYDSLLKAIDILRDNKGIYLGKRKIGISTVGLVSQIYKLAESGLGIQLSISLHSADSKTRSAIMPVNKKYPLSEVIKAVRRYTEVYGFPVLFEYILIKGVNSSKKDALNLSRLVKNINCKVNLIPYNWSGYFPWEQPSSAEVGQFYRILKREGVFSTLRRTRGGEIEAACGQLRVEFEK